MFGRFSHTRLLRHAGLFTWAMVGVPLVYSQYVPADGGDDLGAGATRTAWLFACYLGFGASYWWLSRGLGQGSARWPDRALLLLLTVLALAVSYFNGSGLGSILLMVAAGVIPWLLPAGSGVVLLLLSQLAVLPIYYGVFRMPLFEALMQSLLYAGFSLFIYVTSLAAKRRAGPRPLPTKGPGAGHGSAGTAAAAGRAAAMPGAGHGTDQLVVGSSGHRQHRHLEGEGAIGQPPGQRGMEGGELRAEILAQHGGGELAGQRLADAPATEGHLEGAQTVGGQTMKKLQPPLATSLVAGPSHGEAEAYFFQLFYDLIHVMLLLWWRYSRLLSLLTSLSRRGTGLWATTAHLRRKPPTGARSSSISLKSSSNSISSPTAPGRASEARRASP